MVFVRKTCYRYNYSFSSKMLSSTDSVSYELEMYPETNTCHAKSIVQLLALRLSFQAEECSEERSYKYSDTNMFLHLYF